MLEDPAVEPPPYVYQRTISPMDAPDAATDITIGFNAGDAVSLDGETMSPATLFARLNELGRDNGIGRVDLVENRFVGMKSRGVYETPGGTILLAAHRAIESITLDRGAAHLKDELMPRYAELIYNGFWFSPEREMLQALIDKSQEHVEGLVRLKLYKGNVIVTGRESGKSLYSTSLVTFEDDKGAYDQKDAEGFIRLNALGCGRWRCAIGRREGVRPPLAQAMRACHRRRRRGSDPLQEGTTNVLSHGDRAHRRHHDLSRHDVRAGAAGLHLSLLHGGNTQMMSAGFIIVVGLLLSILLHELGHAFAGRLFKAHVSHIELMGLGGIAHFERSLPRSALARSVIYLAGPAVNLGLWQGLGWLAGGAAATGNPMLALPLAVLASGQLLPDVLQPAAGVPAGWGPDARCVAGRAAGAHVVGAHRRLPRPGGRRRGRALRAADRHLHAVRRLLPGAGELGGAAERRRLVAAEVAFKPRRRETPPRGD